MQAWQAPIMADMYVADLGGAKRAAKPKQAYSREVHAGQEGNKDRRRDQYGPRFHSSGVEAIVDGRGWLKGLHA